MNETVNTPNTNNLQLVLREVYRTAHIMILFLVLLTANRLVMVLKSHFSKEEVLADKIRSRSIDIYRTAERRRDITPIPSYATSQVIHL